MPAEQEYLVEVGVYATSHLDAAWIAKSLWESQEPVVKVTGPTGRAEHFDLAKRGPFSEDEREYVVPGTRMFALVTIQGTAMGEAALCQEHSTTLAWVDLINTAPGGLEDWDGLRCQDVTGNEAMYCAECGLYGRGNA